MYVVNMILIAVLALLTLTEGIFLEEWYLYQTICKQNVTEVEGATEKLNQCLISDFGLKKLQTEVNNAYLTKNDDTLNSVIKKYCLKSSVVKDCFNKFMETVLTCLESDKQEFVQANTNLYYQFLDYMCEDDGHAMAEFVSTDSLQCLEEKNYNLMTCIKHADLSYFNVQDKSHPSAIDIYQVYDEYLKCLLPSVKTCRTPIPAKIIKKLSDITQNNISKANTTTTQPGEGSGSTSTTDGGVYPTGPTIDIETLEYPQASSSTIEQPLYKPSTTTSERYSYNPSTTSERYWYQPSSEQYTYQPSSERYTYQPSSERYWYRPSSERYWYQPSSEQYRYQPSSERYWYQPSSERYGYQPSSERYWYHPSTTNAEHYYDYDSTTTTEQVYYNPSTTTQRAYYNPTTTTEKQWNSNGQETKVPTLTPGGSSLQVHCEQNGESKMNMSTLHRRILKAAGNMTIFLNAEIYV